MKDPSRTPPKTDDFSRIVDPDTGAMVVKVLPGFLYVTATDESISTVLGSCVAACLRDPVAGVGGLNHYMLPEPGRGRTPDADSRNRFGTYALENLVNQIVRMGGQERRLEVKLFGGAKVIDVTMDVGARNVDFALAWFDAAGIPISSMDVRNTYARKIVYAPASGRVRMRKLSRMYDSYVVHQEQDLLNEITS
ncbi:MAG: chemoreceptor glutamine deamidase CheD [Pseudomonadales bacterium]|nr:chemoreceptor glutamine deamidase CheD [Pseudomonadales bacterium]MCP5185262.1 chemoreceptor glutamine deamidase CheD [Pseudomonadales bacterium]